MCTLNIQELSHFESGQHGVYFISVRADNIAYDPNLHQSPDSCRRYGGRCTIGVAIKITSR
jgi:hypothetical protein